MMFPQFSMRQRKLIGLFILLIWLTVYALGAMSFAVRYVHDDLLVQTLFYIIAGFAWIIPLKPLLFWMQKKDEQSQPEAE